MKILAELTGVKWGYVKSKQRVKYLISLEIPLKIGIMWGKPYEKRIKYKLDISISNKSPNMFGSEDEWKQAVKAELQMELLRLVHDPPIKAKLGKWEPEGEYAEMLLFAEEQKAKYDSKISKEWDIWMEECLKE